MPNFGGRQTQQKPDFVQIFGHSYTAGAVGTLDQTGRFDALLCSALGTDYTNRRNHSFSGCILSIEGRRAGGWCRIFYENLPDRLVAPFAPVGGLKLFCYGINDLGFLGTSVMTQMQAAYVQTMRGCVSRARASVVYKVGNAAIVFGAGWGTATATVEFTGPNFQRAATTGATATMTFTIPATYQGEPISICLLGAAGAVGGTVTWSGTAGVTGTTSTSNIMPAATASRCPVLKRVTTLTAANAGQTIIATVSALDGSGELWFDSIWIESKAPPIVLVCDVNRLTTAGYSGYPSWTGTEAQKDADVLTLNAAVSAMLNSEFDDAVEVIPLDAIVGKDAAKTFDGIHLNETGAALAVDAMLFAIDRVGVPSIERGETATVNVPSDRMGTLIRPRVSGHWYTAECRQLATAAVPVAATLWAIPFQVTGARHRFVNFCVNVVAVSGTGSNIRWGIYNDYNFRGYPQFLEFEATSAGAFAITTGLGVKVNPSNPSAGSFIWIPDPGLYWIVYKFTTVLTNQTFTTLAGANQYMPHLQTTGAPLSAITMPMGWSLAGQGTGVLPNNFPTGAALNDNAPMVGLKLN